MSKGHPTEVELDSRQRLPLAKVIEPHQHRFRITRLPSGEYLLSPVVSVSERELAVLRNPDVLARLRRGLEQAALGKVVEHPPGYYGDLAATLGVDFDDEADLDVASG